MLYESQWFIDFRMICLPKKQNDYGKVFKRLANKHQNFGNTAYARVVLMILLQSQYFRLRNSFHNIPHKAYHYSNSFAGQGN